MSLTRDEGTPVREVLRRHADVVPIGRADRTTAAVASRPIAADGVVERSARSARRARRRSGGEGGVGGVEAGEVFLDRGHDPPLLVQRRQRDSDASEILPSPMSVMSYLP